MATSSATLPKTHGGRSNGIIDWLSTVDHKKIGILYIVTSFIFFILGGILALLLRLELSQPGGQILSADTYNQIFSMHGTTMIFLFVIPMLAGIGNYFVPLQIGARDMAFPRLNALSYWLYLFSGLLMYSSFLLPHGTAAAGWTGYAPLSGANFSPYDGTDIWIISLQLVGISSLMGSVNFATTILNMRAPGMTLWRMPLFVWTVLVMAFMVLLATPVLTGALMMLLADRNLGTQFFLVDAGDPIFWQHLFWFYSHPAVYIMILPPMGVVSEILPVFSRKPIFGYKTIIWSTIAIGALGFTTWAHHMFTTGLSPAFQAFFILSTMSIAVPTGVKMFNWIFTMMGGSLKVDTPLLFSLGFLSMFLMGGLSGVFQAVLPVNTQLHDTFWVVAHLHYVLFGGTVFGIFAGLYYWGPKIFGWMLDEKLGKIHFWLMLVGFNLTFFPMHILGLLGMPRRIYDYVDGLGWEGYNIAATVGSFLIAFSMLVFILNFIVSLSRKVPAGNDPWEGNTLEWITTSPPPEYNFAHIPEVSSERPARDIRLGLVDQSAHA